MMPTQIATIKAAIGKNSRKAVEAACIQWRNGIVEVLTGNRTGRIYPVGRGKRATYTASAPGEPPAVRTGALRSSYKWNIISDTEGEVGSALDYSLMLEKGTSRMLPRPHIMVGYERKRKEIEAALTKEWDI